MFEKVIEFVKLAKEKNYLDYEEKEFFEDVEEALFSFPNYVNSVYREQTLSTLYRFRYEGQDLRDAIMNLDSSRRIAHEHAIVSLNMLNKMAEYFGYGRLFEVDSSDRYKVADFCGDITMEIYNNGISENGGIDKAIETTKNEYNKDAIKDLFN